MEAPTKRSCEQKLIYSLTACEIETLCKQESYENARGAIEKHFEVRPSRTSEKALVENISNNMLIIDISLEKEYKSSSEYFLNWLIQYLEPYLRYLCLPQIDLMLHQ